MNSTILSCSLLATFLVADVAAQTVHRVGPGQPFAEITAAVQAASPGDVVEVLAGVYSSFVLDKALTIRVEPTGAAVTVGNSSSSSGPTYVSLPNGAHARLCGLTFHRVQNLGDGVLSCEGCALLGSTSLGNSEPGLYISAGSVTLWRCQFGSGAGIIALDCELAMVQCDVVSSPGYTWFQRRTALRVDHATVHASACAFVGGDSHVTSSPWPAIHVPAGTVDLVDCTVQGGNSVPAGALGEPALLSDPGAIVRHQRTQFTAGTGPGGSQTPIMGGGTVVGAPLLGVQIAETSLALGGTLTAPFHGEPNGLVLVLAAFQLSPPAPAPFVSPLHWGFGPNLALNAAVLLGDPAGQSTFALAIPALPPLRDLGVWLTGIEFLANPFQLSPPVGGVIR